MLGFTEEAFEELVTQVARETGVLLEVVNYNVEGQQYVCAGHVSLLFLFHSIFAGKTQTGTLASCSMDSYRNM